MLKGILGSNRAAYWAREGFTQDISNPALNWAGIHGIKIAKGSSRIETAAVLASLRYLKPQAFLELLTIQHRPGFELQIDKLFRLRRSIQLINDPMLEAFTKRALELAPPEFFIKASSCLMPIYHPLDEFTIGGQILHTCRAAKLGFWLHLQMFPNEKVPTEMICALILHDIYSQIEEQEDGSLVFTYEQNGHGILAAKRLRKIAEKEFPGLVARLEPVFSSIYHHLGRWESFANTKLTSKNHYIDWHVSATDAIAAFVRSYVAFFGLPAWASKQLVFSQQLLAKKQLAVSPLPGHIHWANLSSKIKKAILVAKILFYQYSVFDKSDQAQVIWQILKDESSTDKELLSTDVLQFITAVSLAAASIPAEIFDIHILPQEAGIKIE